MSTRIHCCETCRVYWTCETKWYRGEKGEENLCCPICNYFKDCSDKARTGDKVSDPKAK